MMFENKLQQPIKRSWMANSQLQKSLDHYAKEQGTEQLLEDSLIKEYLRFLVRQRLMQYLIAGKNDSESFRSLIETVVQLVFGLLISSTDRKRNDITRIRCEIIPFDKYSETKNKSGLGLNVLGQNMILGSSSTSAIPIVAILVKCSLALTLSVYDHLWTLQQLLVSLEEVVPLNQLLEIRLKVFPQSSRFKLAVQTPDEITTRLGLNSII